MRKSLRGRLLREAGIGVAVIFVGAAVVVYALMRRALLSEFDRTLVAQAQAIAPLVEFGAAGVRVDADALAAMARDLSGRGVRFVIRDGRDRKVIACSPAIDPLAPPAWSGLRPSEPARTATFDDTRDSDAHPNAPTPIPCRALAIEFTPRPDDEDAPPSAAAPPMTVVVARDVHVMNTTLRTIGGCLASVCSAATLAALLAIAWTITRGLRPVSRLATQIERLDETNLGERVSVDGLPAELTPIAGRINAMLSRLDEAFRRERAFTADAAHELRTPLAGLETAIEVSATRRREPDAYRKTLADCLVVVLGMRATVDGLLALARSDANHDHSAALLDRVDLPALIESSWRSFASAAADRNAAVTRNVTPGLRITTDGLTLERVLANLFDNATQYVDAGGRVDIRGGQVEGGVSIIVANTGSRVANYDAARVFDRFWRGDVSRTGDGRSSGLGLAICRSLVQSIGGSIDVATTAGGEFRVTVTLPC